MVPKADAEDGETLEELLTRQRQENKQRVLNLNGPIRTPDVIFNEAAHQRLRKREV